MCTCMILLQYMYSTATVCTVTVLLQSALLQYCYRVHCYSTATECTVTVLLQSAVTVLLQSALLQYCYRVQLQYCYRVHCYSTAKECTVIASGHNDTISTKSVSFTGWFIANYINLCIRD